MSARLLPLLLALCTLLPAELRARMVESCRERDECCCRRDQHAEPPLGPTVQRVDCCEAPCSVEHASASVTISARRDLAADAAVTLLARPIVTAANPPIVIPPPPRGRDPPLRLHALTQRWLV